MKQIFAHEVVTGNMIAGSEEDRWHEVTSVDKVVIEEETVMRFTVKDDDPHYHRPNDLVCVDVEKHEF